VAGRILLEGDTAEATRFERISRVIEVDAVDTARAKCLRKVHEDCAGVALVLERSVAQQNLIDVERGVQIELDAGAILEHFEANGVLAADKFFFRIDADIEVIEEQIVVGAVWSVLTAQDVGMGGSGRLPRRLRQQWHCGACQ